MVRALSLAVFALLLTAAEPALAWQSTPPPSGPRDRRPRKPEEAKPVSPTPRPARPERGRGPRGRSGSVTVVPGSELSSSPGRTRSDGRGVNPAVSHVTAFSALVGFDEARLKGVLGAPHLARDEGQGSMWTYRLKSCALHVFLARDTSGALKVKAGAAGPLIRGGATPTVDACVAEAPRSRPQP